MNQELGMAIFVFEVLLILSALHNKLRTNYYFAKKEQRIPPLTLIHLVSVEIQKNEY